MSQSPNTKRLVRWALPLIAVALLVSGLAGPVQRAWQAQVTHRAATALAERVAAERAAIKAEFDENRARILAELREQVGVGHYAEAMNAAGRYAFLNDPELLVLYRQAAGTESIRQRGVLLRDVVARDCTEKQAHFQMLHLQGHERRGPTDPLPPVSVERITRVASDAARAAVLARMREPPPPHQNEVADEDWLTRIRTTHRARPLPEFQVALAGSDADAFICVWRLEGTRWSAKRDVRFTLDLWLAPAPDGKNLQPDPVGYSEQPA